ncbi:hypothetical protein Bca101_055929 [Brassica carinata]
MESTDSIAEMETNELTAKKESTDSITEIDSNQEIGAHSVHRHEKLETECAKVEQPYILDMDVVEKLTKKSVEAVDVVAHKLFDLLFMSLSYDKTKEISEELEFQIQGDNVCKRKEKATTCSEKEATQIMEIQIQSQGYQL